MTTRSAKDPPLDRLLTGGTYVLSSPNSLFEHRIIREIDKWFSVNYMPFNSFET